MKRFLAQDEVVLVIKTRAAHDDVAQRLLQGGTFHRESAGAAGIFYTTRMSRSAFAEFLAIKPDELKVHTYNFSPGG